MIKKFLLIGDLHAQINNLEDTEIIFDHIEKLVKENDISFVVYLGDMYHTHSVMRQEVVEVLQRRLRTTKGNAQGKPIVLVGNHDLVGPTSLQMNACDLTLSEVAAVISEPLEVGDILFVPFIPNNDVFINICNNYKKTKIIICHQTFDGSVYENGFYAPGGIDQKKIPQQLIISGHIHKRQTIGNVVYVGTPRALTAAEYNENKGLIILEYDDSIVDVKDAHKFRLFSLNPYVKTFKKIDVHSGTEANDLLGSNFLDWNDKDHITLHLYGNEEFCEYFDKVSLPEIKKQKPKTVVKLVYHIETKNSGVQSIDVTQESLHDALKRYVFDLSNIKTELKEEVWQTVRKELMT